MSNRKLKVHLRIRNKLKKTPSDKNIPDLLEQVVFHKAFGEGIVRNIDEGFIFVDFSVGEKKFHFPDVFKSYLSAKNPAVAEQIALYIREKDRIEKQRQEQVAVEGKRKSPLNNEVQYDVDDFVEDVILEDFLSEYQNYLNEDTEMDFGYMEDYDDS